MNTIFGGVVYGVTWIVVSELDYGGRGLGIVAQLRHQRWNYDGINCIDLMLELPCLATCKYIEINQDTVQIWKAS